MRQTHRGLPDLQPRKKSVRYAPGLAVPNRKHGLIAGRAAGPRFCCPRVSRGPSAAACQDRITVAAGSAAEISAADSRLKVQGFDVASSGRTWRETVPLGGEIRWPQRRFHHRVVGKVLRCVDARSL
jgi:hypothetical protein